MMAELGFRTINEMVGRVDMLELDTAVTHWKAHQLDLTPILTPARKLHADVQTYCTIDQDHSLDTVRDMELLKKCEAALKEKKHVRIDTTIQNIRPRIRYDPEQ